MATDSCKKHNGDYCFKDWVTTTRDLDDRSQSYADDYQVNCYRYTDNVTICNFCRNVLVLEYVTETHVEMYACTYIYD